MSRAIAVLGCSVLFAGACARSVVPQLSDAGSDTPCTTSLAPRDASTRTSSGGLCSEGGFCWDDPLPFGTATWALWSSGPDDLWVRGVPGELMHWNGATWSRVRLPLNVDVGAIGGTSSTDLWLVGSLDGVTTTVMRGDGVTWREVPGVMGFAGWRPSFWVRGANDVWLLATRVWHSDGATWTDMTPPGFEVYGLWHVGDQPYVSSLAGGVLRWDGTRWLTVPVPTSSWAGDTLTEAGVRADDAWLMFGSGPAHHWDGTQWTSAVVPTGGNRVWWRTLRAFGRDDIWAIGEVQAGIALALRHWDGSSWQAIADAPPVLEPVSPEPAPGASVWVGGARGRVFERRNGAWMQRSGTTSMPDANGIFGLGGVAANDLWAVGQGRVDITPTGLIAHHDAEGWHQMLVEHGPVSALWVTARDDAWAVGSGTVLHWDGRSWSNVAVGSVTTYWRGVWSSGAHDVWLASSGGLVHGDGTTWTPIPLDASGMPFEAWGVSGTAADDVWVIGGWSLDNTGEAIVQHWDGHAWSAHSLGAIEGAHQAPPGMNIRAISAREVWVGASEEVHGAWRWDGHAWTQHPDLVGMVVWATSPTDVWFGATGDLIHWDGRCAIHVATGSDASITAMWGAPSGELWVSTGAGGILRREP